MLLRRFSDFLDERGQAMVLIGLMIVVIAGMAALSVDVGLLFNERRHLQTAADAGALAGANAYEPSSPSKTAVESQAQTTASQNAPSDAAIQAAANTSDLTVTVTVSRNVDLVFGRVLGFDDFRVGAKAVAQMLPAGMPTEAILPLAFKDPRYDNDGNPCPDADNDGEVDTGAGPGCLLPEDADIFDDASWEKIDEADGDDDGYIEMRYSPHLNESGNFAPISLDPINEDSDECWGMHAAGLYECQLEWGGYLKPDQDGNYPDELYLDTKTGNVANATFEGIEARFARITDSTQCSPGYIADPHLPDTGGETVLGVEPCETCPLYVTAPLIKAWPNGTSDPVYVTAWVGFGIIGVCDTSGDDPFKTDKTQYGSDPDFCDHKGGTALIFARFIEEGKIPHGVPMGNVANTGQWTVKLID